MKGKLYHIALCLFIVIPAISQTQVEVITKTVKDQFDYRLGFAVEVEGKTASVFIESWDKKEIGVEMKLISKGLTKAIAEKELKYQKYVISEIKQTYVIRNYLLLPTGLEKLSTIQETEIKISVPQNIELSIRNAFGNTTIKDVRGKVVLESEYGEMILDDISGNVRVNSTFGDLKIKRFEGFLTADLQHTTSLIEVYSGSAFIKTNLGDINWTEIDTLSKLKITAEKSDVNLKFSDLDLASYYWNLRTKYGEIAFPGEDPKQKKIAFGDDQRPPIDISTDFGKITIEK
ncbi:MAG: DUF4097 family beta strand repeat-containing protein [Bacteroidota bacterium]